MVRHSAGALVLCLLACGRVGFAPVTSEDAPSTALAITAPARVLPRATVALAATEPVAWSVTAGGASVDAAGVLRAPATADRVTVQATSLAAPDRTATATIDVTATLVPSTIADAGTVAHPLGLANQPHGLYADELGQWWLFYESSAAPAQLRTRVASSFDAWADGAPLDLTFDHGNDARNLAFADRVIAGHHVVHLSIGYNNGTRGRIHAKAVLAATGCAFDPPVAINAGGNSDPDGPAVAITGDGHVIDGTGWEATPQTPPLSPCGDGDVEIYTSRVPDTGATRFDAVPFDPAVIWCVPDRVSSRWLYADGDRLFHLYDDAVTPTTPTNILWNERTPAGAWLPDESTTKVMPPPVFGANVAFDNNDWGATALGRTLHAVRFAGDVLEHRTFALDGGVAWSPGPPLPSIAARPGAGVVLLPHGAGLLLVLATPTQLVYTFFDGAAWSEAIPFDLAGATPDELGYLRGSRPALVWTEGSSTRSIRGALLP